MSRTFNGTISNSGLHTLAPPWSPGAQSFTLSAWIFPTAWGAASGNGPGTVFGSGTSHVSGAFMDVSKSSTGGGGTLTGKMFGTSGFSLAISADSVLSLNTWQYVTYEFNRSTFVSRLFINGIEVTYTTHTTGTTGSGVSRNIYVGNDNTSSTGFGFTGSIDTAAIWTDLLTTVQIQAAMAYQGTSSVDTANLIEYWPLLGTTSPEPNSVSGGATLSVNSATQGTNSPGQTPPGSFVWIGQEQIENSYKRKH